ncbi:peptidase M15 [Bradyrhizobium archetypum]|uniref:peptidase M15 n=1 Tax=Bradyrhizobium archetypum TaxID=2721160 RepID=UPI001AEE0542|nr:peptidase M15 [Bradyrhizobium archetypum]
MPPVERRERSLIANTAPADTPQAIVTAIAAEVATATASAPEKATNTTAGLDQSKSFVVASLTDPAQVFPTEAPAVQAATASTPDLAPAKVAAKMAALYESISLFEISLTDPSQVLPAEEPSSELAMVTPTDVVPDNAQPAIPPLQINEECLVAEICIDRYLWALYERAPKIDAIKVHEQRKVTIKRKGKTKTVTRTFTRRVDEDFTWKDPKAAERAGMSMMDYVIGGMDRKFKLKLFHTLHAAEQAGLSPGITSAFRDDYRQGIASGLKAATDRSYHGGSFRGGYGRGLAADIVSVKGATRAQRWVSTEKLWKWIDAHGKEFGIGRPYLDRDPPHVAPTDGQEYVSRRGGEKTQIAEAKTKNDAEAKTMKVADAKIKKTRAVEAKVKKGSRQAARDDHRKAKRVKTAKIAKTAKTAKTAKLARARTM